MGAAIHEVAVVTQLDDRDLYGGDSLIIDDNIAFITAADFKNLLVLGNAKISFALIGENVKIEVWDQGKGIPTDQVEDIFVAFKRLENSSIYDKNGLGLGLAIVDKISKVLEHPIGLVSEVDRGSVFSITVPLVRNFVPQVVTPMPSIGNSGLSGVRVLCIDNEEKILVGLELLLERWQCEVLLAKSLEEAIELLDNSEQLPDIMLADYHLDDQASGLDAMDALRQRYNFEIPGVLITADTRKQLVEEVEGKNYRYMAKMVRPAALRAVISSLVNN